MKHSMLKKSLTLGTFLLLIAAFIVYKTGRLDGYIYNDLQTSPNGGALASAGDTTKKKEKPKQRMSGSKSMVMSDDIRMSSSKSGAVFTPQPTKADSAKKADSVKASLKK